MLAARGRPGDQARRPEASAAIAAKLVADVKGEAFFSGGSWDYGPVVRHDPSGMVCRLFSDPRDALRVYEHPGAPRGVDVSCGLWVEGVYITLYATPTAVYGSLDLAAAEAEQSLKSSGQFGKIEDYRGAIETPAKGMPKTVVRRFTADFQGARMFTRVALMEIDGWIFKQRASAPIEIAAKADQTAELIFNTVAADKGLKIE